MHLANRLRWQSDRVLDARQPHADCEIRIDATPIRSGGEASSTGDERPRLDLSVPASGLLASRREVF